MSFIWIAGLFLYNSLNLYATYKFDINQEHNFTLMGGFNQDSRNFERQWSKNFNMISNDLPSLAGGTGIVETSDSYDEYALRGHSIVLITIIRTAI